MLTAIVNARVVLPEGIVDGAVLMEDGRILAAGKVQPPEGAHIIDAMGAYAGPGYVDIHCHGGGAAHGHEEPKQAAGHHLQYGTTSLLLSLAYSLSKDEFLGGVRLIRQAMEDPGCSIAGIHYEGPYTNPKYGATSGKAWKMDRTDYERLFAEGKGIVCQCTYAPELPGAREFARFVHEQGVALAVGHTEMSPAVLEEAVEDGATIVTHLYDAMGCWRGNDSIAVTGVIQETAADVALAREGLYYELICDSRAVHVKPTGMRLAYRTAGADRLVLITDATVHQHKPADYPESDIRSAPDLNFNPDGELSGSLLTMENACRNMKSYTGASVEEIFKMASRNPAVAVGIYDRAGSLEAGKPANIVLCDEDMAISEVYFKGQPVRGRKGE